MQSRWFDSQRHAALIEGAIWDRRRGQHESAVEILKCVTSRIGTRYLVEGLESGRQWLVSHSTLLDTYEPRETVSPL
jgi:hypothetical protein